MLRAELAVGIEHVQAALAPGLGAILTAQAWIRESGINGHESFQKKFRHPPGKPV